MSKSWKHIVRRAPSQRREATRGRGGYVYVLDNPSMPGLLKIGMTQRTPQHRVRELSGATGVPTPFRLVYWARTSDCAAAEERVHHILRRQRVSPNREFFKVSEDQARKVIRQVASSRIRRGRVLRPWSLILAGTAAVWALLRFSGSYAPGTPWPWLDAMMGSDLPPWFPELAAGCVFFLLILAASPSSGGGRNKGRRAPHRRRRGA